MSDNKTDEKPTLTERESELLIYYIRTAEGGLPKADWTKFSDMAGFKNAHTAAVSFNKVKKKIIGTGDASPAKSTPTKATSSGKRKQNPPKDAGEDEEDESPTKKMKPTPKKGGKKGAAVKEESDDEGSTALV